MNNAFLGFLNLKKYSKFAETFNHETKPTGVMDT